MGWFDLFEITSALEEWFARNDDDLFDRINHRWTVVQLVIFAGLLSTDAYIDNPISCWVPVHFHDSWEKYTNSYCWVRNTYYVDFDEKISSNLDEREHHPIRYYQWVPLMLLLQAIMFYAPIFIWRSLNSKTGINVNAIVESAELYQRSDDLEERTKTLNFTVRLMDRYLGYRKHIIQRGFLNNFRDCQIGVQSCFSRLCCCCCGKKFGNYMSVLYIIIKVWFLLNAVSQFLILDAFLGHDYHFYGIHAIRSWLDGVDFGLAKRFPKVTLCDLDVRRLGNVQKYTVQCVLTINLLNQMIFLYLWFWLVMVMSTTVIGLFMWIMRMSISRDKATYIRTQLASHPDFDFEPRRFDTDEFRSFVTEYLKQDGALVLRLIDLNTNKLVVREVVGALWENFRSRPLTPILPTTDADPSTSATLPLREKS
ncbi:hypothetical protein CAPTEDRAFT_186678 [Capitella teleta]|uniref:Innexin n=1 Tax=Capitella teleta TaxID=283909 RepID=R7TQK9_CAPTE|nr:hypothetical protein CAPTEDRAFT_186678 [Capitella teleta]|eukprot:ELT95954.1 hypothetical protein CAPTEDRAFT_186678 [Capitella teleta]